ncbi:unnamed protein product [Rotaria sp. Silwood1]|nr:unnamed protein product [Rotaria sp. Silwood1]CAF5004218.1 unnamed protein product [Rotaria sp. Silwood1]
MTHQFLPCLMQLKLSSEEDQVYITEIQRVWCLLLDKLEPTERSLSLEEFLQRLLEQPIGQHYHSVSINKHQLVERYDEAVRDLIHRYPSFSGNTTEQQQHQQQSPNRSNRTSVLTAPVPIPVVIQQEQQNRVPENMPVIDPRGSSPMQQGDDEQDSSLPPSSS